MLYFLPIFIFAGFTPQKEVNPFVGTWESYKISSFNEEYKIRPNEFDDFSSTIIFNADLTFEKTTEGRLVNGKYEFTKTKLKFLEPSYNASYEQSWMIRKPEDKLLNNVNYPEFFIINDEGGEVELDVFYRKVSPETPSLSHSITDAETQVEDTLFYDYKWDKVKTKDYSYYSILTVKDSLVMVKSFTKKGALHSTSSYHLIRNRSGNPDPLNSINVNYQTGLYQEYSKGRLIQIRVYEIEKNMDLLGEYAKRIDRSKIASQKLYYQRDLYKKGFTKIEGLLDLKGDYQGVLVEYYKKEGLIFYTAEFKDGYQHGETIFYYADGDIMSSNSFKMGEKDGVHKKYDGKGNLKSEHTYENGELISKKKY